jgi:hypothetical protein
LYHLTKIDLSGTGLRATTASGASQHTKIVLDIKQFTQISIAKAFPHMRTRCGASRDTSIAIELTRVIASLFDKMRIMTLVIEYQAVTGGTDMRAGATSNTGFGRFFPLFEIQRLEI